MADEKKSYPSISRKSWFALRKQFARTMPTQATPSYVANVLEMKSEDSARANVVNGLKLVGLIDNDHRPTQLAVRWRDDDQYAEVCEEIRQTIYPNELRQIAPDSTTPSDRIERWFAKTLGIGESAAGKLATFYSLLCEADPSEETEATKTKATNTSKGQKTRTKQPSDSKNNALLPVQQGDLLPAATPAPQVVEHPDSKKSRPSLHIDVQIHISPESSAEQIEQIFASMAKHLKDI